RRSPRNGSVSGRVRGIRMQIPGRPTPALVRWFVVALLVPWGWHPAEATRNRHTGGGVEIAAPALRGAVIGADREPVAGASLRLTPIDASKDPGTSGAGGADKATGATLTARTDERGGFRFDRIPAGEYRLECVKDSVAAAIPIRIVVSEEIAAGHASL